MPKVYLEQFIEDWSKALNISGRWKWSELLTATQSQSVGNIFQELPKLFLFLTKLDFVLLCLPFDISLLPILQLFYHLISVYSIAAYSSTFNFGEERPRCLIIFNNSGVFFVPAIKKKCRNQEMIPNWSRELSIC